MFGGSLQPCTADANRSLKGGVKSQCRFVLARLDMRGVRNSGWVGYVEFQRLLDLF